MSAVDPTRRRVAVVYHFFPHYRRPVMAGLLASRQHHYTLVGDPDSTAHDASIAAWVPPAGLVPTRCRRLISQVIWQRGICAIAANPRYDTVIFLGSMNFLSTWIAALVARACGKRILFWAHGWNRREQGLKGLIRRCYFHLSDRVLLYGRRARAIARLDGFPAARLWVIYNSLDHVVQTQVRAGLTEAGAAATRRELLGEAELPMVICTTRLIPLRRLDLLIEAAALLQDQGHRIGIALVGDGPVREELRALATDRGVRVHFHGACYDEAEIGRLIHAACVTVAPGKVGLTAMHSLGFGVPVITHADADDQMPEWEAIVPGRTGDLFRRGDVADLARVLKRWTGTARVSAQRRQDCLAVIERFYNPAHQVALIDRAVTGAAAPACRGLRLQAEELGDAS